MTTNTIPSGLLLPLFLLLWLLMQFHMEEPALPVLGPVSAILCAACLAPKLQLAPVPALGLVPVLRHDHIYYYSVWFASAAVSAALPADAISRGGTGSASFRCCFSNLCAACRVPLHLDCSWHRFLLWVRAGS